MKTKWIIGVFMILAMWVAACQTSGPNTAEPSPPTETTPTEQPTQVAEPADEQPTQVVELTPEQVSAMDPELVITPGFSARYECVEAERVTRITQPGPDEDLQITDYAQGCGAVPEDWSSLSFLVETVSPDGEIQLGVETDVSETEEWTWSYERLRDDTFTPLIEFWAPMDGRVFTLEGHESDSYFRSEAEFRPLSEDQTETNGSADEVQVYEGWQVIETQFTPGELMRSILARRVVFHRQSGLLLHSEEIQTIIECEVCDPSMIGAVTRRKVYELAGSSLPGLEDIALPQLDEITLPQLDEIVLPEVEEPIVDDQLAKSASEMVLFRIPDPPTGVEFFTSADGRHLASIGTDFSQETVMGQTLLALDGKPLNIPSDAISCYEIVLSAEASRVAYICYTETSSFVYENGERVGGPFLAVTNLIMTHDGEHLAYAAHQSPSRQIITLDGQIIGEGENLALSPDGEHIAYGTRQGRDQAAVIDGVAGPPYTYVGRFIFSPNSERIAYVASVLVLDGAGMPFTGKLVVVDGLEGNLHSDVRDLTFSDDSQHFAYIAQEGDQVYIYLDGEQFAGPYRWITEPTFSPDGEKFAYIVSEGTGLISTVYVHLGSELTAEYPAFRRATSLTFSPDGEQLVFIAGDSDTQTRETLVVINGEVEASHANATLSGLTFSPDGENLLYLVEKQGTGDIESDDPVLSWAGPHGFGLWYVVVDGEEGEYYNGIYIPETGIVFDSENQFHYLALKPPYSGDNPDEPGYDQWRFLLVEEKLE